MNKKLLTLAVAAAVAAPTAAMAEAILYGKLHQSIDYVDISNAIATEAETIQATGVFETTADQTITDTVYLPFNTAEPEVVFNGTNAPLTFDVFNPETSVTETITLAPGQSYGGSYDVTTTIPAGTQFEESYTLLLTNGAGEVIRVPGSGQDFKGWGISGESWRKYTTVNPGTGIGGNVNDRANRIGVKGSEDLGNGLKAIYQVEFGINLTSNDNDVDSGDNGINFRNSFVGIASDYGSLLVGRHDTPLKISTGKLDLFSDTMADYNGTVGFHDVRADNVVAYISPTWSGFSFMGAVIAGGGTNVLGPRGGDDGLNINDDSIASAYSLAIIYNNGPFYGSAAYEVLGNEHFMNTTTSNAGKAACTAPDGTPTLGCDYVDDDFSKWRLGLGILDWNGFTLTAIYEDQSDLPGGQIRDQVGFINPDGSVSFAGVAGVKSQRLWQVQAGYSFGNNMFKAMYGSVNRDAGKAFANFRDETVAINNIGNLSSALRTDLEGDRSTWAVGFDHNFSKRTKVYALYTQVDDDFDGSPLYNGVDWSGFSLGLEHAF